MLPIGNHKQGGFTLLEVLVYTAILSLILLLVGAFVFYLNYSNGQSQGDREALENSRRVLEEINYEIMGAKGVYTPTTTASQLSLETARYLPAGETTTYIDFFMCGDRICMKKESQNSMYLTSDTVIVNNLAFTQIAKNGSVAIKTDLTVSYKNPANGLAQSVSVTSTASLRSN